MRKNISQSDVRYEVVTPDKAEKWLEQNKENRRLGGHLVRRYRRDMENNEWADESPDPIVFGDDGLLREGQHRLHALVRAGKPQVFLVVRNCPREAWSKTGRGRKRSALDQLLLSGEVSSEARRADMSIARRWLEYLSVRQSSDADIADFVKTFHEMFSFARANFGGRSAQGITTSPVQAGVSAAVYHESSNDLADFVEVLFSGIANGAGDAGAIRVRELVRGGHRLSGETEQHTTMRKAQRGVKAFCDNEELSRLHDQKDVIYPLPDRSLQALNGQSVREA